MDISTELVKTLQSEVLARYTKAENADFAWRMHAHGVLGTLESMIAVSMMYHPETVKFWEDRLQQAKEDLAKV